MTFVDDYAARVRRIGAHPDKLAINDLTKMASEVAASSANALGGKPDEVVGVIEKNLIRSPPEFKLPLVYLMDSILYNVRGVYQQLFSRNLSSIFKSVYSEVSDKDKEKMIILLKRWAERTGSAAMDQRLLAGIRAACDPNYRPAPHVMNPVQPQVPMNSGVPPMHHVPPPNYNYQQPPAMYPAGGPVPPPYHGFPPPPQQAGFPHGTAPGNPHASQIPPHVYHRASVLLSSLFSEMKPPIPPSQQITLDRLQFEKPDLYQQVISTAFHEMSLPHPPGHIPQQPFPQVQPGPLSGLPDFSVIGVAPALTQSLMDAIQTRSGLDSNTLQYLQSVAHGNMHHPAGQQLLALLAQTNTLGNQSRVPDYSPASLKDETKCNVVVAELFGLGSPFGTVTDTATGLKFADQSLMVKYAERQFELKQQLAKRSVTNKSGDLVSRMWYLGKDDWVKGAEQKQDRNISFFNQSDSNNDNSDQNLAAGGRTENDGNEDSSEQPVLADDAYPNCAISGEAFETLWNDACEEWVYKDAIRPDPKGPIYLISAWKAKQLADANATTKAAGVKRAAEETDTSIESQADKKVKSE